MALPVILVNSATGSDSAASGAGPATALTGSSASTSGTGLVVTLDGSPNLSGVATDGSHVIYLNDSTANARNFGKITAADNTAKTVTVSDAFGLSLSGKSWAIGGVRASINANGSEKLWSTSGSTAGDVMPGWTVRMQSGHAESGALITMRRGGNLTAGVIALEGESGAATRPVYTSSAGAFSTSVGNYYRFSNFDIKKSGSSGSSGFNAFSSSTIENIRVLNNGGVKFATGISAGSSAMRIVNNYIESVTGVGIDVSNEGVVVRNNIIKGCGTWGITSNPNTRVYMVCEGNIITGCTSGGIQVTNTFTSQAISNMTIANNTIHGNSGPGIEFVSSSVQLTIFQLLKVVNNQLTSNTGYGIKFAASITDAILDVCQARIWNNNFYGNTLGATPFALTLSGKDNLAVNPGYTNSASNDFRIDGSTKAAGYMKTAIGSGIVAGDISYIDIGALQRVEPSASSGGSYVFGS